MPDNAVTVDAAANPSVIQFSSVFNVAVPLIDRHIVEGRGEKTALRTVEGDVTYAQLAGNVNRCGNSLKSLGAGPGDRVVMVVKDCPEFFYLFWGAIKAGIVPVPVNTLLRSNDYQYMIDDSECAAVVYSPEFAAEVEPALAGALHRPAHAIRTEGEDSLKSLMARSVPELQAVSATADDDCFWLYSSGSTGRPKGVVHQHRDIVETCVNYAIDTLGMIESDVCFSAAKLFFAYGLGNAMTFPLWTGATAVLSDLRPTPEMAFDIIQRFKPTIFFGVPTLYAAQLRSLETVEPDLSSLRACVSAGESLPADIFRRWQEQTGLTILDGIGSTEVLHIFISNRLDDFRPGSSGCPVPGYQAKIIGDNEEPVIRGQTGQLMIKGGSNASYYWNNPQKTAATMVGDWINTGDIYLQDADGYYIYCGRNDDMLKVGGIWCSPVEIENLLIEHPKVLEAAVVGRADDDELVKPEAFVVLHENSANIEALSQELLEHCKNSLARYKYPRWFNFVDDLPKTATGKIQRFKLRQSDWKQIATHSDITLCSERI